MSAIVGAIYTDPETPVDLSIAMDALAFYGDDASGIWTDSSVGLGQHTRYLTPASHNEQQPLAQDHFVLVADSRLDYREELCAALALDSKNTDDWPDSQLILLAYQKWGTRCLEHLFGDYAFAIWDQNERRLFCGRDHIGARPFYYYHTDHLFAFATDIKALLRLRGFDFAVNMAAVADILYATTPNKIQVEKTLLQDVYRLPYGHWLQLDSSGNKRLERYWKPEEATPVRLASDQAYAEAMYELVEQAVITRLNVDVPIGAHLSGGIDSTSIAVIAHYALQEQNRQLVNYSWSPQADDMERGEYRRILRVRDENEMTLHFTDWDEIDIPRMLAADPLLYETRTLIYEDVVQRHAQRDGVRYILSGWGGDEFVSYNGRGYYRQQFMKGHWWPLLKNLHNPSRPVTRHTPIEVARTFWRRIALPSMPPSLQQYFTNMEALRPPKDRFIHPDFPVPPQKDAKGWVNSSDEVQLALYHNGHIPARMESWYWSGSQHDVTYSFPLTDRKLMDYALAIPEYLYVKDGWERYIYRTAMDSLLPEGFVWNRLGAMKSEPRLQETHKEREFTDHMDELLKQNRDMTWVNVPKLIEARRAVQANDETRYADRVAISRAVECVKIWHFAQQHINAVGEPTP